MCFRKGTALELNISVVQEPMDESQHGDYCTYVKSADVMSTFQHVVNLGILQLQEAGQECLF